MESSSISIISLNNLTAKKKILIVGPSWVGDMVMAQSLFKLLKDQSPETIIDVIAPEWSLSITERMPEVNNSINSLSKHNRLNLMAIFKIARSLKTIAYDQAIILPRSLKSALIPWLARIPIRTGYRGEMRYGIINDIREFNNNIQDQTVKRYAALGLKKGNKEPSITNPKLDVSIQNCKRIFNEINVNTEKKSIGILPGAEYGQAKKWPASYYSIVVRHYLSMEWNVFLMGSKKDQRDASIIIKETDIVDNDNLFDLTGKTTLTDVVDILSNMNIVLTNDSGLMHITAAVETPLVAVYGPTSPEYTPPLSERAITLRKGSGYSRVRVGDADGGYHSSLIKLMPDEVLLALEKIYKKHL